jgi:hypothetical protein
MSRDDAVRAAAEAMQSAGVRASPSLMDAARIAVDAAAPHLLAVERERIARAIRTDCRHGLMYAQGWYIGCPPCAACNDAANIAEEDR